MSFGDVIAIMVMYGTYWLIGAVLGSVLKGIFGRYTMLVLTAMHISVFIALVCIVGEASILEVLEELMSLDFLDGCCFVSIPCVAVVGSRFGQKYRVRIERR